MANPPGQGARFSMGRGARIRGLPPSQARGTEPLNEEEYSMRSLKTVLLIIALSIMAPLAFTGVSQGDETNVRWDIISIDFVAGTVSAGGNASAKANEFPTPSKITVTGSGTFETSAGSDDVTGGGSWQTFDPAGNPTASGTYTVTRLVRFDVAPGTFPPQFTDNIG